METHPNASITFKKSDMQYWISSDAFYLSVSKARSCVGGYHFLGNKPDFTKLLKDQQMFINHHFHVKASILKSVIDALSEAELAGIYVNYITSIPHHTTGY